MKIIARYYEIIFFFYCRRIIYQTKTISKLHEILKSLSFTNLYDADILIDTSTDMFVKKNNIPLLIECAVLEDYYPRYFTSLMLRKNFKIDKKREKIAINTIRNNKITPQTLQPAYPKEVHEAIKGFRKATKLLDKWDGIIENDE